MAAKTGRAALVGLVGHPITHSLSPAIHEFWMAEHSMDAAYIPIRSSEGNLVSLVQALRKLDLRGLNVTVPFKSEIMPYLDSIDDQAQAIGAVNTIVIEHGRWHGLNTDAAGFLKHLRDSVDTEILSRQIAHSLVLGAGGAARSIVAALIMGGARDITICNRSTERTINLIEQLTPLANNVKIHALSWEKRHDAVMQAGLIVNTTTLGMDGYPPLELSLANAQDQTIVSDIVYAPLFTPLLQQAQQRGLVTVDGLGMLLGQAAEAFTHWFAISPTINEALRTRVMASHEKKQ